MRQIDEEAVVTVYEDKELTYIVHTGLDRKPTLYSVKLADKDTLKDILTQTPKLPTLNGLTNPILCSKPTSMTVKDQLREWAKNKHEPNNQ